MIEIGTGHYYYFDLDKINSWIFNNPSDKKNIEKRTSTFTKEDGDQAEETLVIESNSPKEMYSATRFDLLSDMLNSLFALGAESSVDGVKFIQDIDELGIANKLVLNTLMENEFLVDKLGSKKKR